MQLPFKGAVTEGEGYKFSCPARFPQAARDGADCAHVDGWMIILVGLGPPLLEKPLRLNLVRGIKIHTDHGGLLHSGGRKLFGHHLHGQADMFDEKLADDILLPVRDKLVGYMIAGIRMLVTH